MFECLGKAIDERELMALRDHYEPEMTSKQYYVDTLITILIGGDMDEIGEGQTIDGPPADRDLTEDLKTIKRDGVVVHLYNFNRDAISEYEIRNIQSYVNRLEQHFG